MEQMKYFSAVIIIICRGLSAIIDQADVNGPIYLYQNDIEQTTYKTGNNAINNKWQECDLPPEEQPDYYYFTNAGQSHYNLSLEYTAAFAVKDYGLESGIDDKEWELKRICRCENAYQVYVESKTGNELYILLSEEQDIQPNYIIMADIRKGDDADVILQDKYSYNSMLEWYSYKEWFDGKTKDENIRFNAIGDLYDSIYNNEIFYAIYDYMDLTGGEQKGHWEIDDNDTYVGRNGYIVCANCNDGARNIIFLVDVWNKTYAVIDLQ